MYVPFCSDFWRAMEYIDDTLSFDILEDKIMAYQAGLGLSKFHRSCSQILILTKLEIVLKIFIIQSTI